MLLREEVGGQLAGHTSFPTFILYMMLSQGIKMTVPRLGENKGGSHTLNGPLHFVKPSCLVILMATFLPQLLLP